jgi:hypothetical protein
MAISDSLYCKFQLLQPQLTITAILIVTKFVYIYIYIYMCVCVCMCMCICVCVCVHMCVYTKSVVFGMNFYVSTEVLVLAIPPALFCFFIFFVCYFGLEFWLFYLFIPRMAWTTVLLFVHSCLTRMTSVYHCTQPLVEIPRLSLNPVSPDLFLLSI